jgi:hypothetical protein
LGQEHPNRQERWEYTAPLNLAEGTQVLATAASPMLAGFSFAVISIILTAPDSVKLRWEHTTLTLLVVAALLFTLAIQSGAQARSWHVTPGEVAAWMSHMDPTDHRRQQSDHAVRAQAWGLRTRLAFDAGTLVLFLAMAAFLTPRGDLGDRSLGELAPTIAVCFALLVEVFVICRRAVSSVSDLREVRRIREVMWEQRAKADAGGS